MNILVTGGSGFIGSHLCKKLLEKGGRVICVDNLLTGDLKNLSDIISHPQFQFVKQDIISPIFLAEKIDQIYHLASPASPIDYQNYPLETLLTNSQGTYNLLELARKNKARFLFASTSEVYGDPLEHPQKETYWGHVNSFGPRSCYDEAKRFAESLCYTYLHKFNVDMRIIRIFNTYGSSMQKDDGRVVSNFINQALENEPVTIYGKGSQTRSFCYVDDLIKGIVKMMGKPDIMGEIINLGNPDEYSILEIAKVIIKLTSSKSKIIFKPLPQDDPTRRQPDISKAKKLLGWEPKISLKEGLLKTIEYFKN